MRRVRLAKIRIEELEKRVDKCRDYNEELIDRLQGLKDKCWNREITYSEYLELTKERHDDKTISEWIEYYDKQIEECKKRIEKEKDAIIKSRVLLISYFVFFGIFLFFFLHISSNFSPTLTGFLIEGQKQEFVQNLDLEFNESSDYELRLENPGILFSFKISGSIEGGGDVKIYLDELLIFNSQNADKNYVNFITGRVVDGAIGQIEGNELEENGEPENSESEKIRESNSEESHSEETKEESEVEVREFSDVCEETCDLRNLGLNKSSYVIRIESTNVKIRLDKIKYEIFEVLEEEKEISEEFISTKQEKAEINRPTKWTKSIKADSVDKIKDLAIELPKEANNIFIKTGREGI